MDTWKVVPKFPSYEASSSGLIRNKETQKILATHNNGGYIQLHLYRNKVRFPVKLHRIIAETFILNPEDKPTVNHKNKDTTDNRVVNLEWQTQKENNEHKVSNNYKRKDATTRAVWKCHKDTHQKLELYSSFNDAAKSIDSSNWKVIASNIRSVLCGKYKQSNGFFWIYEEYPVIEGEIWREIMFIQGVEGYQISSEGRLRDADKKMFKGHVNEQGYVRVSIDETLYRMHILVAKAFLPNFHNKPHVNHKDGNRSNNRLYNLEWCTRSENMQHAYDTGLNTNKKLDIEDDK
jgi:hypothetical protein